ncbi:MAG: hypothetical protein LBC64_05915 [Fibromonadaceae bacterium]|nr:hypothetical protein [Fibromonadaceae bacterium]
MPLNEDFKNKFKDAFKDTLFKLDEQSKNGKQPKKDKKSKGNVYKFLIKVLLYPQTRSRIWQFTKKLFYRVYNLFSIRLENVEVRGGTLGDPFYDAMALGISRGSYYPDWENENKNWSAKGYIVLKTGFLRGFLFFTSLIYQTAALVFILWRGLRRAKKAVQ